VVPGAVEVQYARLAVARGSLGVVKNVDEAAVEGAVRGLRG
jgi:hypothetical protein